MRWAGVLVWAAAAAGGGGDGAVHFEPPELDEEEEHSLTVPDRYRCDACRAVAFSIDATLAEFEKNPRNVVERKGWTRLRAAAVIEALELVCSKSPRSHLAQYGLKVLDTGGRRLSGPGLPAGEAAGMTQGGGKWPSRLAQICQELVGELDEDGVYELHQHGAGYLAKETCSAVCGGAADEL